MIKKVLANIILNIAIITLALSIYWAFKNSFYAYAMMALAAIALCIYLKIRVIKSVRQLSNKSKS